MFVRESSEDERSLRPFLPEPYEPRDMADDADSASELDPA